MAHLLIWLITWMGGNGTTRLTSLAPSKGRPEMTPQSQAWQYRSATGYILCSVLLLLCLQKPPSTPFTLLFLFGQSGGHLENLLTTKNTWEWYKITWMSQCYLQHFFCEEQSEYVGHFLLIDRLKNINWLSTILYLKNESMAVVVETSSIIDLQLVKHSLNCLCLLTFTSNCMKPPGSVQLQ